MTDTANLALPCIEGSQAQKHITHNDALRILDTLVQLAVLTRSLSAPPSSPTEGQRWIVKLTGTGAWAGHDNAIAAWQDGAWQFSAPQIGWCAFVADEGTLLVWNGTAWGDFFSTVTGIQNLAQLGIGTTADSTNVLSAKLNNTLFAAKTTAEGGTGDLRYKVSKASAANTGSFLFQDNFSGRAEIGLTGDDDLHFKVSPDGTTWFEGIKIAAATGKVSLPASGGPREMLAANREYYVRSDGSDSNDGLTNTSSGAFLTIQKAINTIANTLDLAGFNITIQVGTGTYTGNVAIGGFWVGFGSVLLLGDTATPSNCLISTVGTAITVGAVGTTSVMDVGASLSIAGFKITTSSNGSAISAQDGSSVTIAGNMEFGAVGTGSHIAATRRATVILTSSYKISGNAGAHLLSFADSVIQKAGTVAVTLTGSPVFSTAFANVARMGQMVVNGMTFSGTTGTSSKRYQIASMSLIDTGGAGTSYFPGDTAGTGGSTSFDGSGFYN